MNDGTQGDAHLARHDGSEKGAENVSAWQHLTASDCWSKDASEKNCLSGNSAGLQLSAENGKADWMEERVKHRVEELAKQYGLDPSKASIDDVILARAAEGNKNNEGRVERLRVSEAQKYNLDPAKADWKDITDARIHARKKELGME
jgi:hypothetical protein